MEICSRDFLNHSMFLDQLSHSGYIFFLSHWGVLIRRTPYLVLGLGHSLTVSMILFAMISRVHLNLIILLCHSARIKKVIGHHDREKRDLCFAGKYIFVAACYRELHYLLYWAVGTR